MPNGVCFAGVATVIFAASAGAQEDKAALADFLGVEASRIQPPASSGDNLIFQTNVTYDPRVDLRTRQVMVHRHGAPMEEVAEGLTTWRDKGYDVVRMFFISSDAAQIYERGGFDGAPHPQEAEIVATGEALRIGGHRAYMFPTEGWEAYLKTFIDHAVELGVAGVAPEEPFGHAQAGYGAAYKQRWEAVTGEPWGPPHASPQAFWQACQFKSNQFYDLVADMARYTKQQAAEADAEVAYILPIHSILSNMAGGRIFPNVRSIGMKDVDAWIGQVWQGPVLWALGDYAGSRYDGFFESALGLYSTFAELKRGVDRPMYFLVDPVEDDPHRSWPIYKRNYEMCVVAMLHHHWVDHYEVMPWPDRIYLPGFTMGSGTPGPSDYLTQLMAVQTVLDEMPGVEPKPSPNDQGLGLLFSDTASWEIQGPQGPSFDPFHGLYLPFVKDGVMVRTPWLERVTEPGYLDEFKVLLLTYDNQKPVRREIHTALLEWVNNGGHLVFIGGQSAYDEVGAWWNEAGYEAPVAALLDEAGVPVDTLLRRQVERLRLPGDGTGFDADLAVTLYDLAGEAEEAVAADREGLVGFRADIGAGSLTVSGTPSGWAARSAEGAAFLKRLVYGVADRGGVELNQRPVYSVERGPYVAAYALKGPFNAEGAFVDLFDPAYPIVSDPTYPKASSVLLKRVDAEPAGELPKLLFSSYRLVYSDAQPHQLQAVIEGPAETLAAMRVVSPGDRDRIALAEAVDAAGEAVPVVHKYDPDSHSSLVQFEYDPEGVALRLSW